MTRGEFGQLVKDYFSFTRSERKGMLVLGFLLVLVVLLNLLSDKIDFKKPVDPAEFFSAMEKIKQQNKMEKNPGKVLFRFNPNTISGLLLDSLSIPKLLKDNLVKYRSKGGSFRKPEDVRKLYGMDDSLFSAIYPYIRIDEESRQLKSENLQVTSRNFFEFDPNIASVEDLKILGFNSFQIKNLMAYRNKGGKFHHKIDLLKVYGIDTLFYKEVCQWIRIDNIRAETGEKHEYQVVELNMADSAAFLSLPGIGPAFAGRIIRYRRFLGGFYNNDQLLEVYGMTGEKLQQFSSYVIVDKSLIKPIRLNFADVKTLSMHPYLSGTQARQIVEWRSANGPITKKEILLENNILDLATFGKVEPYLSCQ
jgi:DNA uptake protein ComE-like DNA-binding protein